MLMLVTLLFRPVRDPQAVVFPLYEVLLVRDDVSGGQ